MRPLTALAHTDLKASEILLHRMVAAHLISESELQSRTMSLAAENDKLKVADLTEWLGRALIQGDLRRAIDLRSKLASIYWDRGDWTAAEQVLDQVCEQLREWGDLRTWAVRMVAKSPTKSPGNNGLPRLNSSGK